MQVTQAMLEAAMAKAVEIGMLPGGVDEATYLKNWKGMREVLRAALDAPTRHETRLAAIREENEALAKKLQQERAQSENL